MPLPSTRQSHMDVFLGKAAGVDDNHQINDIAYKRYVLDKSNTDYTLAADESGALVVISGATADNTITLPAPADGVEFSFFHGGQDDVALTVSSTGNDIIGLDSVSGSIYTSAALTTTGDDIGGWFTMVSDGTNWFSMAGGAGTITYAT